MMMKTQAFRTQLAGIIRPIRILIVAIISMVTLAFATAPAQAGGGSSEPDYTQELKTAERLVYKEKYSEAIDSLKEITEAEPDNADAWNLLGFASRKSDQLEEATAAYEQALALQPEHKSALEYQGELFIRLGNRDAAEANLQKLETLCPDGCEELDLLQQALSAS